jgi:rhodanese-related sulfurtransferase
VSQGLVIGIFPGSDPVAIEGALATQNVDLTKVKVVRLSTAEGDPRDDSNIDFIDVAANMDSNSLSDDMTKGMGIMGDAGGTGVPMGRGSASLGSFSSRGGGGANYLVGLPIPYDEIANFNSAIQDGRAVVAYPDSGADSAAIAVAFKAAGLRNVRTY